ncbi:hypothetical protein ACHAO5_005006 [Verticillium nonalfalfae]
MVDVARAPRRPGAGPRRALAQRHKADIQLTLPDGTRPVYGRRHGAHAARPVREAACQVRYSIWGRGTAGDRGPLPPSAARGVALRSGASASLESRKDVPPSVSVVMTLVIRRQSYRAVGSASIVGLISTRPREP